MTQPPSAQPPPPRAAIMIVVDEMIGHDCWRWEGGKSFLTLFAVADISCAF
jgi:hypothetical protein